MVILSSVEALLILQFYRILTTYYIKGHSAFGLQPMPNVSKIKT
jgi:hypothetical protein